MRHNITFYSNMLQCYSSNSCNRNDSTSCCNRVISISYNCNVSTVNLKSSSRSGTVVALIIFGGSTVVVLQY